MSEKNIPTDEEFARADALMRDRDRGLDEIRANVLNRFMNIGVHEFYILYSSDSSIFTSYVFFENEMTKKRAFEEGVDAKIENFVRQQLIDIRGLGVDGQHLRFDFDTDENVRNNYDGDYFSRLR